MSNPSGRPVASVSGNVLVLAIAGMFIAVVAAVVALAIGLPESQNPAGLAAQLLGGFATLVIALGTLFKVGKVAEQVKDTATDTQRIVEQTNGRSQAEVERIALQSAQRALQQHIAREEAVAPGRHAGPS